ncbi:glycosyltransferase 87 family protein [Streptacidiphilus anmyonensis]|uniref:glycosyltransferase 87 family protein n=1 Tax=Streptacidiphilus anmyonensis TaxID=405782 RepID=UPI0006943659|nr:glycosyltransferase 87 family protein [Streptacidiphilus anmyonensis]
MSAAATFVRAALARPEPSQRPVRSFGPAALALGLAVFGAALASYVLVVRAHPDRLWSPTDLQVYYWGGATARHTPRVYDLDFHIGTLGLPFTYTPFALGVFMVLSRLSQSTVQWLVACGSIATLVLSTWLAWGLAGYRRNAGRLGAALTVAGLALWTEPMMQNLAFGQVNVFLMVLVLLDFTQRDRWWSKGVGVGLAAGFKLVPAIFIVYLLVTRRLRAAAVAAGTFAATVVGGYLALPREAHRYWLDGLFDDASRMGVASYVGNQSLQGLLARTLRLDVAGVKPYWLLAALAVTAVALPLAALAHRRGEELLGVATTALLGLLVSPISWSHHWVWIAAFLVAGGCLLHARRARWWAWLLAGGLYLLCFAWPSLAYSDRPAGPVLPNGLIWLVPYGPRDVEYHWHGLDHLTGNLYPLLGLLLLAGLAVHLLGARFPAPLRRAATSLLSREGQPRQP